MNVTHFVENLNRGGLERTVIDLIRAQLTLGHRCQVVCLFERGVLAEEVEALGVAVHACGKRRGFDVRALARARRLLREHGTEILHTHNATAHYHAVLAALGLRHPAHDQHAPWHGRARHRQPAREAVPLCNARNQRGRDGLRSGAARARAQRSAARGQTRRDTRTASASNASRPQVRRRANGSSSHCACRRRPA